MELADIATVVDGNDNGSHESECEEAEGEVEGAAASSEGAVMIRQHFRPEKPNRTKPPLQVLAVAEGNSEKNKV
jgi:hypothetical protein